MGEVKSTTAENIERQLRLGLGEVPQDIDIAWATKLSLFSISEQEPTDRGWQELCDSLNVIMLWPGAFDTFFL